MSHHFLFSPTDLTVMLAGLGCTLNQTRILPGQLSESQCRGTASPSVAEELAANPVHLAATPFWTERQAHTRNENRGAGT